MPDRVVLIGLGGIGSQLLPSLVRYLSFRPEPRPLLVLVDGDHAVLEDAIEIGLDVVVAPVDPVTTMVDIDFVRDHIVPETAMLIGTAGNYAYGTIDSIPELSDLAVETGSNAVQHLDHCHARAQGAVDVGEFTANDPTTDDEESIRQGLQVQGAGRVHHARKLHPREW